MNYYDFENDANDIGIIALESCRELGLKISERIRFERMNQKRIVPESYLVPIQEIRFSNGEGKVLLEESARGKDIYIICDIGNYSCTYELYGHKNRKGPDEHFQDIKRAVSAIGKRAKRITVIMPLLYAARQHKRKLRESLDCALALRELEALGVNNIITFDAHDPNVQNAIPYSSFENFYASNEIIKQILYHEPEIIADKNKSMLISPDTGAMDRTIYYSSIIDADIGLFYKRRDYSRVENGKNPIVQHEYMGQSVEGKNILIVDDMISSGESILDIIEQVKLKKASRISVATTFAMFSEGAEKFNDFFERGMFNTVYSTNLTYVPESVKNSKWFVEVDMSTYIANIIDTLNNNSSITPLMHATLGIRELIDNYKKLDFRVSF